MRDSDLDSIQVATTDRLGAATLKELRRLFFAAFDDRFGEEDWHHALGGEHVIVRDAGVIVAHGAVVERHLRVDGVPFRTGYVEAVATLPARQRQGLGRMVMTEVGARIRSSFELGALATGVPAFYAALGWETWRGSIGAYDEDGVHLTPDEDGAVMVLRCGPSVEIDLASPISAPTRPGDDW